MKTWTVKAILSPRRVVLTYTQAITAFRDQGTTPGRTAVGVGSPLPALTRRILESQEIIMVSTMKPYVPNPDGDLKMGILSFSTGTNILRSLVRHGAAVHVLSCERVRMPWVRAPTVGQSFSSDVMTWEVTTASNRPHQPDCVSTPRLLNLECSANIMRDHNSCYGPSLGGQSTS